MKAQDFRVGNLIRFISTDEIEQIVDINSSRKTSTINNVQITDIDYVPLTEEWLLKLGMVKVIGWDDMIFWRLEADKDKGNCFELLETLQGYQTPNDKVCKYIHTLQNCYYFHELTGKELLIK